MKGKDDEIQEREHCPELCEFVENVKDMVNADKQQDEEIPKFKVPLSSWLGLGAVILGIVGFVVVMFRIWI